MKCVHVDAEGFCGNKKLQGGGFKCCHCGAFTPDKQSTMKNNKSKVVEAEVVEVTPATGKMPVAPVTTLNAQNREGIMNAIARQIEVVQKAELVLLFQRLRLGALVKNSVVLLGMDSKGGNGSRGDGVKGWWEENYKGADGQPVIKYTTLMNWISAAEKIPEIMRSRGYAGFEKMTAEKIIALLAKDPEKVVGKEAKLLNSTEKVANGMTMRQMLLRGDAEEARRPGRPKGSGKPAPESYAAVHKTASENAATAYAIVWGELDKKRQLPNLASLLKVEDARDILALVEPVYHALKKRVGEG